MSFSLRKITPIVESWRNGIRNVGWTINNIARRGPGVVTGWFLSGSRYLESRVVGSRVVRVANGESSCEESSCEWRVEWTSRKWGVELRDWSGIVMSGESNERSQIE